MLNEINMLIQLNIKSGSSITVAGHVDNHYIDQAEAILAVQFPISYVKFIEQFGCIEIDGRSFSGLYPGKMNIDGDVVAFTQFLRNDINLPHQYIALDFQDGDYLLCINTEKKDNKGESPVVLLNPITFEEDPLNNSFFEYIIEYLEAKEK